MANIARVVAYNSTTRRFYATDTNDKLSVNQIPLSVDAGNGLIDNNGLYVPKIDTLTFSNDTITINMTDGTNKSVSIPGISADKFLQSSSYDINTKTLSLTMNDATVISIDMSDLVKINVSSSNSIELTGNGTSANPLTANVKLSTDANNGLTQTATGLFANISASFNDSTLPSGITTENGSIPTTILGSLSFILGAPSGWVEIAGGKKVPYWKDAVSNVGVNHNMLFRQSDYTSTPTIDYYGNSVTTNWTIDSGDFIGTGNTQISILPTPIMSNTDSFTFEMWYHDTIPDIEIPTLASIVNGDIILADPLYGNVATVNTTSGVNHFAISYTNGGQIAGYLNGTKIFYASYNTSIPFNIDSFVLKSSNVMEAAFYVNSGNIYPASTAVNSITPNPMPLQPIAVVTTTTLPPTTTTSTTTTTTTTTTTMPPYPVWVTPETFTINTTDSSIVFNATNATSYQFISGTLPGTGVMNANGVMGNGTTDSFYEAQIPVSFTLRAFTDATNYPNIYTDRVFAVTVVAPCITGQVFKLSEITPEIPAGYNVIGSITPTANAYTFDSASIEGVMPVKSCNRNLTFRLAWEGTTLPYMAVRVDNGDYLCGISNYPGQLRLYYGYKYRIGWLTGPGGVALSPVAGRNELVFEYSEDGSNSFFSYWLNGVRIDRVVTNVNFFNPDAWTTQIGTIGGAGSTFTGTIYCADLTTEALYGDVATIPSFSI